MNFFKYLSIGDNVIKKGLDYIKSDFDQNYAELKHIMYLSKLEGFENVEQIHVSDTFQRAILNDSLIDIAKK